MIWRYIPGFEGQYKVSNTGLVMSCSRIVHHPNNRFAKTQTYPEIIMKLKTTKFGYKTVKLSKNSVRKDYSVHRLVAQAFLKKVEGKDYIDHKDGNKANNRASNLEWVSIAENNQRAYNLGLKRRVHAGQFLKGVKRELQGIIRRT